MDFVEFFKLKLGVKPCEVFCFGTGFMISTFG
jgi:hypothetical protein